MKTKTIMIAEEPVRCNIVADGEIIEQVMKFSYLGFLTTESGLLEKEVGVQVMRTHVVAGCAYRIVLNNKRLKRMPNQEFTRA